ncbi:MAG: hypothetical protein ACFFD4_40115 [Candidatus Odinarchaeota archaeon]
MTGEKRFEKVVITSCNNNYPLSGVKLCNGWRTSDFYLINGKKLRFRSKWMINLYRRKY